MQEQKNRGSLSTYLLIALLMLIIGGAGGWFLVQQMSTSDTQEPAVAGQGEVFTLAQGEVFLEPAGDIGPDPFTDTPLAPPPDPAIAKPVVSESVALPAPQQVSIQADSGAKVGLYGGSLNNASCDVAQLINYLSTHPEKAKAWVAAQNADPLLRFPGGQLTPADIPNYINSLTPVILRADTRVTNHGFNNGVATPRQSVLQKGTAVLVDIFGVPRARCYCGNPLLPPEASKVQVTYVGSKWEDFDPASVTVVQPAPEPLPSIKVVDPTGQIVELPTGTDTVDDGGSVDDAEFENMLEATGNAANAPAETSVPATQTPVPPAETSVPTTSIPDTYPVQITTDPYGRITMPVPEGWETESEFLWTRLGENTPPVIYQRFAASPNLDVLSQDGDIYSVPSLTVRHFWPTQPSQALDLNNVVRIQLSKLDTCTQVGTPQSISHPRLGDGILIINTDCQNNPTAQFHMLFFPQTDGSIVRVSSIALNDRDINYIQSVLDGLTVPQVSAPAPPTVPQDCSSWTGDPMDITVTNNTNEFLRIYWYDYDCKLYPEYPDFIQGVSPGGTAPILQLYQGNRFVAVDLNGAPVSTYEVPAGGGAWNIP